MRRLLTTVAGVPVLIVALLAEPGLASWVSNNCYVSNANRTWIRRIDARTYAEVAVGEGYEWGGGCWNDNNVDDTPGQPDSSGEGPDCSGFTFKSWYLKSTVGTSGYHWWSRWQNIHGPYASSHFHAPLASYPFYKLPNKTRETTYYMDAFAKDGHIGMIHSDTHPSANTDYIIEALGDTAGTDINEQTYRGQSQYVGVRREGWYADCYPQCPRPDVVVVVE
jgi:hypothetical protein